MRRSISASISALVVLGCFVVPVRGELISGTLEGDSTLTPTAGGNIFIQNLTGEGDDTTFGAFTAQSQSTIDFSHPPAIVITDGTFVETFSQGTLFGTSSGEATASGNGTANATVEFVFTGGTGIFAGATGEATFTGMITSTSPTTESITGTYTGTLSFIPEPNTLLLFGPALAVGGVIAIRRRRSEARLRWHL
jgi:hypothetical protein